MYYDKMDINRNETQTVIKINNKDQLCAKKKLRHTVILPIKIFVGFREKMQTLKRVFKTFLPPSPT